MASVTRLERLPGRTFRLLYDDGSSALAFPSSGTLWTVQNPSSSTPTNPGNPGTSGQITIPDSYVATSSTGESYTMIRKQLEYAAKILEVGRGLGLTQHAIVIAFMTVFAETRWWMYANSNVPESLNYPHDAVGSDHDSCGLFQQRPSIPWGTVAELMDVTYNGRAFYGGPQGPNAGNPPGLLDIPGWADMGYGQAAQAVQGSAFPDRYDEWRAASDGLYAALTASAGGTGKFTVPFSFSSDVTSEYGPRPEIRPGSFHEGTDFGTGQALAGATIKCAAAGTVHTNGWHANFGNLIIVHHGNHGGKDLATLYAHRVSPAGPAVGQSVAAGADIGQIGNTGASFGAHLHHETHVMEPGGSIVWNTNDNGGFRTAINPRAFYEQYG